MITILKRTPATIDGRDCYELLVHDDNINDCTCCDLCIYKSWREWLDVIVCCTDAHGCTPDANTYFITEDL